MDTGQLVLTDVSHGQLVLTDVSHGKLVLTDLSHGQLVLAHLESEAVAVRQACPTDDSERVAR